MQPTCPNNGERNGSVTSNAKDGNRRSRRVCVRRISFGVGHSTYLLYYMLHVTIYFLVLCHSFKLNKMSMSMSSMSYGMFNETESVNVNSNV